MFQIGRKDSTSLFVFQTILKKNDDQIVFYNDVIR